MTKQTLGRRSAAPVQSTKLDLVSEMLNRVVKEQNFCTPIAGRPQGAAGFFSRASNREGREAQETGRRPRDRRDRPSSASREARLPQDLGHRRLSGPPRQIRQGCWRNPVRRGCPRAASSPGEFAGKSGPETAFVVLHDRPNARAAQRRPGAEHRARPVLLDVDPRAVPRSTIDFYKMHRTTARGWRFSARTTVTRVGPFGMSLPGPRR
jgi:hypothetical protein